MNAKYYLIYDGNCNLCVTFTKILENFDQGKLFNYIPMQDTQNLNKLKVTPDDCELGMILINSDNINDRWQGSLAGEKIIELLPNGQLFVNAYRAISPLKWLGDQTYLQIRDNRYQWFGSRENTYYSAFNCGCQSDSKSSTTMRNNIS